MRKMSGNDDTNNNNNTLHSRDNSSGNNSLAANLSNNNSGGGPSPLAMGRKVKEYTGKRRCICMLYMLLYYILSLESNVLVGL